MMGSAIEGTCQSDARGIERARKGSAANREPIGRTRTQRGTRMVETLNSAFGTRD